MYAIDKKPFGFKLTFSGFIKLEEMAKWVDDSKRSLFGQTPGFGVLVDMRDLKPLPEDAQAEMQSGQKLYKQAGMTRSAVILASPTVAMQFRRIAKETGIAAWERYLDPTQADFERKAIAWLEQGLDPDVSAKAA
ncbi:MAG: hypothetical protein SFW67_18565 [Myxococcaceae bacterium]|nr:hypothetical protein [Myxococcaceae bacterium]